MAPHLPHPQRLWVIDQDAEDATPMGEVTDRVASPLVEPHGDETAKLRASLVQHSQRRITGAGDLPGRLEDLVEHLLDVQCRHQAAPQVEQPADLLLIERGDRHVSSIRGGSCDRELGCARPRLRPSRCGSSGEHRTIPIGRLAQNGVTLIVCPRSCSEVKAQSLAPSAETVRGEPLFKQSNTCRPPQRSPVRNKYAQDLWADTGDSRPRGRQAQSR